MFALQFTRHMIVIFPIWRRRFHFTYSWWLPVLESCRHSAYFLSLSFSLSRVIHIQSIWYGTRINELDNELHIHKYNDEKLLSIKYDCFALLELCPLRSIIIFHSLNGISVFYFSRCNVYKTNEANGLNSFLVCRSVCVYVFCTIVSMGGCVLSKNSFIYCLFMENLCDFFSFCVERVKERERESEQSAY